MGFDEGYAGLGRLVGRTRGESIRMIEPNCVASTAPNFAAAAMSLAMLKGDVAAVVAALTLLGVRTTLQEVRRG